MPVDVTGNFIRIRVKNPDLFVDDSFRTIDISKSQGIKAIIGKLKTDPQGSTHTQSFLFDKTKWTVATATAWVKEHEGKSLSYIEKLYKEEDMSGNEDRKVIKYYRIKALKIDPGNHTAKVQVTDETKDRDSEILLLSSWKKHRKSYEEHPVLVSSHRYDNLLHQIGEASNIDWDKMEFDFKWYVNEGNPEADWGWKLAEKGVAMFSVGFIPHKTFEGDAIPEEYRGREPRRVLAENELLEVSQVIVGSNRGALQLGMDNPNQEQYQYAYEVMKTFNGDILDFDKKIIEEIEEFKEPVIVICEKCKISFDYGKEAEVCMGAVKCPNCGVVISQTGKEQKSKINSDSIIISPVEIKNMAELQLIVEIYKSGRIISEKNRTILKSTVEQLQKSMQALIELLEITNPENNGGDDGKDFGKELNEFLQRNKKIS